MKLIDADKLYEVIQRDKYDLDIHKESRSKAVHHGEYQHFLKRIVEQPETTVESVYFNAIEMLVEKLEERSPVIDYSWCLREYKENVKWLKSQNN